MIGKWDRWYASTERSWPYGEVTSYRLGYEWLRGLSPIEDWGCGSGFFKTVVQGGEQVFGIDGSHSKFADKILDLREHHSHVPAIFMRHVLEHNHHWKEILQNALDSFQRRMTLILFVPLTKQGCSDVLLKEDPDIGVPTISICERCFYETIVLANVAIDHVDELATVTEFGAEQIFYLRKD